MNPQALLNTCKTGRIRSGIRAGSFRRPGRPTDDSDDSVHRRCREATQAPVGLEPLAESSALMSAQIVLRASGSAWRGQANEADLRRGIEAAVTLGALLPDAIFCRQVRV